ncbi:uncharacterized protein N7459_007649 [Penicillium hispanicum]|uniref:uncharacterized protein n=1 Tax=Penicillium hispanicum TaxID=1080232 RepID=UPI0025410FF7|nr:uncharacterized protein N7459_007649 [Penicillium hispanicum]KAJ5578685.1 hypothetical protein N7459_007649 [Penicillium hispanicum]
MAMQCQFMELAQLPQVYDMMEKASIKGRIILKLPENTNMAELFTSPSLLPSLTTPKFSPTEHNIGTLLAYRMEELGVRDFFAVPGTCTPIPSMPSKAY